MLKNRDMTIECKINHFEYEKIFEKEKVKRRVFLYL